MNDARGNNIVWRKKQGEFRPISSDRRAPRRVALAVFYMFFRYNINRLEQAKLLRFFFIYDW